MKRILFVGLALVVLVVGGSAFATIPGPDGVIHSCMLKGIGTIRIIDPSAGAKCDNKLEKPLDWNQAGGLVWRGAWKGSVSYTVNDAVQYQGSAYVATASSVNIPPPEAGHWSLLAAGGAAGPAGPQGPQGPQGPKGNDGANGKDGATGPAGPAGPKGNDGKDGAAGLVWRGPWDSATTYASNDAVERGGSAYVATDSSQGDPPPSTNWDLLAAQGETGPQGPKGDIGPQGPAGAPGAGGIDPNIVATLRWDQAPRAYGTFPVGSSPFGVAFDGTSIWVTNLGDDNVAKLRASDGAELGTFPVGNSPRSVAFDGTSIWIANQGGNVTKLTG
jgi:Collagen triple helix repeat (20 copies)